MYVRSMYVCIKTHGPYMRSMLEQVDGGVEILSSQHAVILGSTCLLNSVLVPTLHSKSQKDVVLDGTRLGKGRDESTATKRASPSDLPSDLPRVPPKSRQVR